MKIFNTIILKTQDDEQLKLFLNSIRPNSELLNLRTHIYKS